MLLAIYVHIYISIFVRFMKKRLHASRIFGAGLSAAHIATCGVQKMESLATGPAPGFRERSSVLTQALLRGSAANSVAQLPPHTETASRPSSGGAATGWRVLDFRHANRLHDNKTPSVRHELREAGAGRLSTYDSSTYDTCAPPWASVVARSGISTEGKGTPKSMAEWAQRNAFVVGVDDVAPSAERAPECSQDALSHPGLV